MPPRPVAACYGYIQAFVVLRTHIYICFITSKPPSSSQRLSGSPYCPRRYNSNFCCIPNLNLPYPVEKEPPSPVYLSWPALSQSLGSETRSSSSSTKTTGESLSLHSNICNESKSRPDGKAAVRFYLHLCNVLTLPTQSRSTTWCSTRM